nr:DEAD/DEAH box helicase [Saccharibacter floricola]
MSTKTPSSSSASSTGTPSRTRKTPSRAKTVRKRTNKTEEAVTDDSALEAGTAKAPRKTPTRRRNVKAETPSEAVSTEAEGESAPKKKTTTRKKSTTKAAESAASKKTTRTRRTKNTEADAQANDADSPQTSKQMDKAPPKPRGRPRKTAAKDITNVETVEASAEEAPKPRRRTTTRKKAAEKAEDTRPLTTPTADEAHTDAPQDDEPPQKPARRKRTTRASSRKKANQPEQAVEDTSSDAEEAAPVAQAPSPKDEKTPLFSDLALSAPLLRAVEEMGYTHPTPIQAQAIPDILAGHDVLGVAQTGTGKTASFTLPLLEKLSKSRARARMPRSLILEPTRELALQVAENFERYGKHLRLTHALLIGGGNMNEQRELLNRGVDVLIATPGRLLDLFNRGGLLLTKTDMLVIDEADRMLDMGFIPDIERIVSLLPQRRQTLFFSATMAPEIRRLTEAFLSSPREITIARQSSVASTIIERVFLVEKSDKQKALRTLIRTEDVQNAIIFCNRKRDVDTLNAYLSRKGFAVGHLHGDLTQSLRFETLERFRSGELKLLVCSDIAARGIDIGGLSHVFNYDLPFNAEDYVHRIGRTGRAGKEGHAFTLVTPSEDENLLDAVEALTKKKIKHGMIEGFPVLDWSQNFKDFASDTASAKKKSSHESHPKQRKNKAPRDDVRPSRARGKGASPKGLLPPVPEKGGVQEGFGEYVPAFMHIACRPTPRNND